MHLCKRKSNLSLLLLHSWSFLGERGHSEDLTERHVDFVITATTVKACFFFFSCLPHTSRAAVVAVAARLSSALVMLIKITYHSPCELADKCFMAAPSCLQCLCARKKKINLLSLTPPFPESRLSSVTVFFLAYMIEYVLIGDENGRWK